MIALRIQIENTDAGTRESNTYAHSPVRVGRNEMNDLRLASGYVSQWHAVIQFDAKRIQYLDLGSTNGTVLNGERLPGGQPATVRKPDVLAIGPIQLSLGFTDAAPAEEGRKHRPVDGTEVDADAAQNLRVAHSAVDKLASGYEAYRSSWAEYRRRLEIVMKRIDPPARKMMVSLLESQQREILNEAGYHAVKQSFDLGTGVGSISQLAAALKVPVDTEDILNSAVEALRVFASSFVELRKGFDQFSSELAVRTFQAETQLHRAEDGADVLRYLITSEDPEGAMRELKMAFADMMIHQVALISGVMEGVRGLLNRIGPGAIATALESLPQKVWGIPIKRGIWPWSVTARWRRYEKMHRDFTEEEQELNSVLFGRDFARSYGATAGDTGGKDTGGRRRPPGERTLEHYATKDGGDRKRSKDGSDAHRSRGAAKRSRR